MTPQPTTLGNVLQNKILNAILVSNFLLFYLCLFASVRLLMNGN